ncbi:carboxypeptidase regulatory-like domain-containing protein [Sediminicola arcticus]|uniref:Carboxypeptidase regulatory-like domain-containing protein n=1 Tax=Sediminicola arcticus TaxID=1574308 RepID=A0ABV2SX02_9FLAO
MLTCTTLLAQEKITITGQLLEESTNEPLSFANVSVTNSATNTLVTGAITDENGRFKI